MDSLYHQSQKYLLELQHAANSTTTSTTTSTPPPAYTPNPSPPLLHTDAAAEPTYDADSDSDTDADSHHTITLTASTTIHGSFNLVNPDFSTAMGARIAVALCAALDNHNNPGPVPEESGDGSTNSNYHDDDDGEAVPVVRKVQLQRRPLRIHVDCGVKIVGNRNVVGSVRMVHGREAAARGSGGCGSSNGTEEVGMKEGGGKRRAEDDRETVSGAKRVKGEVDE